MGILDEIEAEQRERPDIWNGAEDKLEEWIGLVPKGSMKPKPKPKPKVKTDPVEMKVTMKLCDKPSDVYLPKDFDNAIDYARALKLHARKIPKGYAAGYILEVELGAIYHKRRVAMPVKNKKEAFSSSDFVLAFTEAMQAILNYKS